MILFRRNYAIYVQSGHTQRLVVDGIVDELHCHLEHDDRKPLWRWLQAQQLYAGLEAKFLLEQRSNNVTFVDRVWRSSCAAPILVFFYTLVWKRCIFDGWRGWFYVLQRVLAELMIAPEIIDLRLKNDMQWRKVKTPGPNNEIV